jgi:CheY-like chemotaxis protein
MAHRLLLADDSVTIQRVIELTFADEDVEVVAVGDGQKAIDLILSDPPDIVLADIDMPERDGFEVATFVKGTEHLRHIPVILLTGAFEPIDEDRVAGTGCEGILVKPFEPQLLIGRVKELVGKKGRPRAEAPAVIVRSAVVPPPAEQPAAVSPPAPPVSEPPAAAPSPVAAAAVTPPSVIPPPASPEESPVAAPASASTTLDEYFEQLDAAFANLGNTPRSLQSASDVPHAQPSAGQWPAEPEAGEGDAAEAGIGGQREAEPARPRATQGTRLASAFSALLSAEQGEPVSAGELPATRGSGEVSLDALVEEVTKRVIAMAATQAVHDQVAALVSEIAERLVREEIERLKKGIA